MKKNRFKIAVLSLSALAFVSCKKDEKPAVTGDMMRFTATIDNGGAKTVIDSVNVKWTDDDLININGQTFEAEVEGDGTTAVFTGDPLELGEGEKYKALCPAKLYKAENSCELPETQDYNEANELSGINPMYAESSTTELQFHHLCGLLKLNVKGEGTVKEIVVSKNGEALCGPFTIENYRAVVTPETANSTVTLKCGDGVKLSKDKATTFYIALPQGNYKDLNVVLKGGKDWNTTLSVALYAGKIRAKELTDVSVVKPETLPGEFSVSATKQVQFSRGNLQYVKSTGEWRFAENQWDVEEQSDQDVGEDYASQDVVTLFGWGTSGLNNGNYFYQPYNTSNSDSSPYTVSNGYGYGPTDGTNYTYGLTGEFAVADWGYSYCVQENIEPKTTWRTLTGGSGKEWDYLFNIRGTDYGSNNRYAEVKVNGMCGVLLFPDSFSWPVAAGDEPTTFNTNIGNWDSAPNYEVAAFAALESAGCVFLPAAGGRYGTSAESIGIYGDYWSSSPSATHCACSLYFDDEEINHTNGDDYRYCGCSVRLVREVE